MIHILKVFTDYNSKTHKDTGQTYTVQQTIGKKLSN